MTELPAALKPPLGAGAIIGRSFSVFFGRFAVFFLLTFGPVVLLHLFNLLIASQGGLGRFGGSGARSTLGTVWALTVAYAPSLVAYALVTALIVLAAYDVKLGRPVRIGAYFRVALARWGPVVIVTVIIYACLALAIVLMVLILGLLWQVLGATGSIVLVVMVLLLLSVPVMYVFSALSVAVAAVVVERIGLRAIGRSLTLTRHYRWSVLGALLVVYIGIFAAGWGLERVLRQVSIPPGFGYFLFWLLVTVAVSCLTSGVIAVCHVLVYARLREIKDGVSVDRLVEVFD